MVTDTQMQFLGANTFDWAPLESMLDDVKSRNRQTVFRVYVDYPDGGKIRFVS